MHPRHVVVVEVEVPRCEAVRVDDGDDERVAVLLDAEQEVVRERAEHRQNREIAVRRESIRLRVEDEDVAVEHLEAELARGRREICADRGGEVDDGVVAEAELDFVVDELVVSEEVLLAVVVLVEDSDELADSGAHEGVLGDVVVVDVDLYEVLLHR